MVGVAGLEPAASRSQTERNSQLCYTPTNAATRTQSTSARASISETLRSTQPFSLRQGS